MPTLQQYHEWFQKSGLTAFALQLEKNIARYRKIQYACQHFQKVEPVSESTKAEHRSISLDNFQIVPPVTVFECLMKHPPLQDIFDLVYVYEYEYEKLNSYQIVGFYEDWRKYGLIFKVIDWVGGTPIDEWLDSLDRKDIEAYSQLNPLGVLQSNKEGI